MTDQYHGQGGSYIVDPTTGLRRRVQEPTRPNDARPAASDAAVPAAPELPAGEAPIERAAPAEPEAEPKTRVRKGA